MSRRFPACRRALAAFLAFSLCIPPAPLSVAAGFKEGVGGTVVLRWENRCDFTYAGTGQTAFFPLHFCDYLAARQKGLGRAQGTFNNYDNLSEQREFAKKYQAVADELHKEYQRRKDALLAETDPAKAPDGKPEAAARKLVTDKLRLEKEGYEIAAPFGHMPEYTVPLTVRIKEIEKKLKEAEKKLDAKQKAAVAKMKARMEDEQGTAGRLNKKLLARKRKEADDSRLGRDIFDANRRGSKGGSTPGGKGSAAKVGSQNLRGGQLADGVAATARTQAALAKDTKAPPPPEQAPKKFRRLANGGDEKALAQMQNQLKPGDVILVYENFHATVMVVTPQRTVVRRDSGPAVKGVPIAYPDLKSAVTTTNPGKTDFVFLPAKKFDDGSTSGERILNYYLEDQGTVNYGYCSTDAAAVLSQGGYGTALVNGPLGMTPWTLGKPYKEFARVQEWFGV